ncbi:MAG: GrpB family protein [Parcubacteria group bacterium]|nr:GrpB family protein [Parcubacteria group bacterium]
MPTNNQEKWLAHLSNSSKIKIRPFDPSCGEKFERVKSLIQSRLGKSIDVEHHGATSLGISGQDEIDVYVPVPPESFNNFIAPLTKLFGEPKSNYPLERMRFVTFIDKKHVDIFLVNKKCHNWLDSIKFEKYLKEHPETLKAYEKLKESGDHTSTREYYRRKIEFINDILNKVKLSNI